MSSMNGGGPLTDEARKCLEAKERLCERAEQLAAAVSERGSSAEMRTLGEEWKKIRHWHVEEEDTLWERFKRARDQYYDARDRARAESAEAKQRVIYKAEALLDRKDGKAASAEMKALMDTWKSIPTCGRQEDERLWENFNSIRQRFYEKQKSEREARQKEWERRRALFSANEHAKEGLIAEEEEILNAGDYSKEAAERMKALMTRWKAVGPVSREAGERLWGRFSAVNSRFWELRREEAIRRNAEWEERQREREARRFERRRRLEEAAVHKREQIQSLYSQIEDLRERSLRTTNSAKREQIVGWIHEKEDRIRELELAEAEIRAKLAEA